MSKKNNIIICHPGKSVSDSILEQKKHIAMPCSGSGTCGHCKIRLIEGELPVSKEDKIFLTDIEISNNIHLACKAFPKEDVKVAIVSDDESIMVLNDLQPPKAQDAQPDFEVQDAGNSSGAQGSQPDFAGNDEDNKKYGIAIDIGTTTIACVLVDISREEIIATSSGVNHQRVFGADVITRIESSLSGNKFRLKQLIRTDLQNLIKELADNGGIGLELIDHIVISANTVMVHLLMGHDVTGLSCAPFQPYVQETNEFPASMITGLKELDCAVSIIPWIDTFVGGDIVSGLLYADFDKKSEISLLADIGTNGEMAVGNKDWIICSSAPAGPAFEGGLIKYGCPGVAGAINSVTINTGEVSITTIGDKEPIGICGVGLIKAVAEMIRNGIISKTGKMTDPFFKEGYTLAGDIRIFQDDIREVQMAKAAICAGTDTIISENKIDAVAQTYIAGGLGFNLTIKDITEIGLIDESLTGNCIMAGNTSLKGAVKYLVTPDAKERTDHILKISKAVSLAENEFFKEDYITKIDF